MKKTRKGFTLVELVIVIAVIAILAAVLIPTFGGIIEKANQNAAMQEARNAYTMYLSEAADDATPVEVNVYVKTTKGWVEIENGAVKSQTGGKWTVTLADGKTEPDDKGDQIADTNIWTGKPETK